MMMIDKIGICGPAAVERVARTGIAAGRSVAGEPVVQETVSTVAALVSQGPPVDVAKVAAIRAAIADGSYAVDADAIAARLVAGE
jgi:negative regulator of flagellin synthesis FlgM